MAAPVGGLDALGTAEAQLQRIFIQLGEREKSLPPETPSAAISTTYDIEGGTATFSATGVPLVIAEAAGVVSLNAAPLPNLP